MTTTPATRSLERVMRVSEVAEHLDCDPNTVYALIRQGEMRSVRIGRILRVPESAVAEFINLGGSMRDDDTDDAA